VDIENLFQSVCCVGVKVRLECADGVLVEVIVLLDQGFVLLLDFYHFVFAEFVMVQLDL
jgi:hypothetical protein